MEENQSVMCPVCTLFLRPGMSLDTHLSSHPKQKVIDALVKAIQSPAPQMTKISTELSLLQPSPVTPLTPVTPVSMSQSQAPTNHSFIYQQFMSSSGPQPVLPQQFVVPTLMNPQMIYPPYFFQQQQQLQIMSNIQPMIRQPQADIYPPPPPLTICPNADITEISPKPPLTTLKNETVIIDDTPEEIPEQSETFDTSVQTDIQEPEKIIDNEPDEIWKKETACQTTEREEEKIVDLTELTTPTEDIDINAIKYIDYVDYQEKPSTSSYDERITIETDDINFILPHEYDHQSIIINEDDELEENSKDSLIISIENQKLEEPEQPKFLILEEKIIHKPLEFEESLNIHADERMPPRGELSEQESNGASEINWGSSRYQEGGCSSGMSTSYDLLARESWETTSDNSDSELPMLQSRVPPKIEEIELEEKTTYDCSTCEAKFRCPKERRVHQTEEHTSRTKKKVVKKRQTKRAIKVENYKEDSCDVDDPGTAAPVKSEMKESLCTTCGVMYPSEFALNIHIRNKHKAPKSIPNICKVCNRSYPNVIEFSKHLKIHPLECTICGKSFFNPQNFKLHLKRHAGIRPHKCDFCPKAFLTRQKLREHTNTHTGFAPLKCNLCDETFRRHSNLVQHRNRHHLKIKKKLKDYVCFCGEIFHTKNKFNWHKEIHDPKPKSCKYCYEKFIHTASLTRHIRRAHNKRYVPEADRESENVVCKVCNGVYLKTSLDAHLVTHSGKRQFSCGICSKEFTTKWNLKLHKWTHASPTSKPFRCEICQAAFIRQSDFISHNNSHRSIKPYTCNYCGCKFIRKYNCIRHVREHESGKSYKCTTCNKEFHRSYYLKEHMRVHSGIRPYTCHICGKTSTTKSNHNKHMKIHHAREPVSTEG